MISRETIKDGFPIKKLGDVIEFLDSRRRPITASDRIPGPYPYYGANGQQDSVADFIFDEPLVLLAEDGGLFDQPDRGIAYAIGGKTWVNNHAHVLRPRNLVELRYLVRVLENYDVTPWITGSTRAKLTKAGASKIQIPLPPLPEQKRIAGILDAADALRAKRRESLVQLDALLQSTFLEMFGDPVTNPMGWDVGTLQEVTTRVTDGTHQSPTWSESGIPFLFVSNIRDRQIDFRTTKFISEDEHERLTARCPIEVGDVLYTTVGSYGNPVRVREGMGRFAFQRHIAHIKPKHDLMDPRFLEVMLDSPVGRRQADRFARGVAQKTLNLRELKSFKIFLPPLNEQRRFATIVESVEAQKARQQAHLAELDALFGSLQSRAFRGEL